jgi:polyisoprenoid-binding protein YceI
MCAIGASSQHRATRIYTGSSAISRRGVTKEIVLDVTLEGMTKDPYGNNRAGFSATGKLIRKDFGLGLESFALDRRVVVGDEVKISIDSQVVAKPA